MFLIAGIKKKNLAQKCIDLALIILIFCFMSLFFRWDLVSVYFKYAILTGVLLYWFWTVNYDKRLSLLDKINFKRFRLGFVVLFVVLDFFLIFACFPDKTIDFEFSSPLKNGRYYVVQGGTPPFMNRGHFNNNKLDRYSIDLVKLNKLGLSAKGLLKSTISDYCIYNDSVYSPCNGIVIQVIQEVECNEELKKQQYNQDHHKTNNIVIIETGQANLILAHLKKGSIVVNKGQIIKTSDFIGLVSNAGTIEPHLHMQLIEEGQATPFKIGGKYLHNNSIINE